MVNDLVKLNSDITVSSSPHPFKDANRIDFYVEGTTLLEILESIQPDALLRKQAHIFLNDELIAERLWSAVCPNAGDFVYISVVPGKGGGGKNPVKALGTIAVIAIAAHFGGPLGLQIGAKTGFFLSANAAVAVGKAVIGGVGMLALNMLSPPARASSPTLPALSGSADRGSPTLFIEGARNSAQPYGTIPVVLGVHKSVPPLGGLTSTEIVGGEQHLRMLVVWGYGRLKIEDIKIGNTPIANFDDVEVETKEGVAADTAMSLYPDQITEDRFSVTLDFATSWVQKTTAINTDEISVDIIWQEGLTGYNSDGTNSRVQSQFKIEYREQGSAPWLTPTFTASTAPNATITGSNIGIWDTETRAVRHGFRWTVASRGTYEVRVQRSVADVSDNTVFDLATWTVLRSINNDSPINFPHPLAMTAIKVKASNQLNGVIENLSATVSSYVKDWDGTNWTEAVSSNPASLFRAVLQHNAYIKNVADSRLDLETIQAFHDYCSTNGFEFNMIRDYKSSLWDTISDICAVARAAPVDFDGKWSVVIDQQKTIPRQHFTPRNSWDFGAEKMFVDVPHGFKSRFANKDKDYQQDELIIYDDGFDATNATEFEQLDGIGITDSDHLWKFGRFHIAGIRLRPERYKFNVDFEYLVARKGDLILISQDVLLVGIAQGRITALQTDGSGDVTGVTVDETLTMESAKDYGVSIRTVNDVAIVKTIVLNVGDQTTIVFDTVIPKLDKPRVGDLISFGLAGSESLECILLDIETNNDISATLTASAHSTAIFTSDTGTIPAFDSKLTAAATLPTVEIENIRTDESVLIRGGGDTLITRVSITFAPPANRFNARIRAQIRSTGIGSDFKDADVLFSSQTEVILGSVSDGASYDIRLQWISDDFFVNGDFSFANNTLVIGQTDPPDPLSNMTISVFGGNALIRWDTPPDLDVRFGGVVKFRHSHETVSASASWSESVSIGTTAKGADLIATLPLKPGTYLARVFDKGGRPSTVTKIDTKQASVLAFAAATNVTEETAFTGIHTNTIAVDSVLKLIGTTLFDDIADVDLVADIDSEGGVVSSGVYDFASNIDLSTVTKTRLTTDLNVVVTNVFDLIDGRLTNIDTWESFDGDVSGEADARVQVRSTDDDPTGSPTWTAWNNLDSAEFNARAYDFRVNLTSENSSFNPVISKLQVNSEELA
jgi:hypothetical protein